MISCLSTFLRICHRGRVFKVIGVSAEVTTRGANYVQV